MSAMSGAKRGRSVYLAYGHDFVRKWKVATSQAAIVVRRPTCGSPDPESGDRFSRFLARREHETHRFLPPILPSLVTHHKRGQVATSGSPDSPTQMARR